MQVHSTQAFAFTSEWNSNVPPEDADVAVDALRPRCCGAFLPIFSVFLLFALDCYFALLSFLSVVSSPLFALSLSFLFTHNAICEYLFETETLTTF